MDAFTETHLTRWAEGFFDSEERDVAVARIRAFVAVDPDCLGYRSWPEIWASTQLE